MEGEIPGVLALFIPITIFMIPIIAILTHHQRKMAELHRQGQPLGQPNEIAEMRRELQQLKEIVAQQAIQMDDFLSAQRKLAEPARPVAVVPPPVPEDIQSRLGS